MHLFACLSVFPFVSPYPRLSLCLSVRLSVCLSLSLCLSFSLFLSFSLALFISFCLAHFPNFSLSLFPALSLSLPLSLALSHRQRAIASDRPRGRTKPAGRPVSAKTLEQIQTTVVQIRVTHRLCAPRPLLAGPRATRPAGRKH